jgi:hypothetical protein
MLVKKRTTLARCLRRDMTEAEKRLWRELRELGLPKRFRRQHSIGKYIVDLPAPQRSWRLSWMADSMRFDSRQIRRAAWKLPTTVIA